jgi:RNA polymerase sigma factor (sigma-70 family)
MSHCTTDNPKVAYRFHQAQAGDAVSLAQLMSEHDGLVHHIIRRQWHGCLSYAEVLQEGRIGLWRAILGFDPARGVAFSTYASVAIARHVWRAVARGERRAERPALMPQPTPAPELLSRLLEQEVQAALYALVRQLPTKQGWIVRA